MLIRLDDLDGTIADETVLIGLDGVSYEVDLTSRNARKLRTGLAPFIKAARRTGIDKQALRDALDHGGFGPWRSAGGLRRRWLDDSRRAVCVVDSDQAAGSHSGPDVLAVADASDVCERH